MKSFLLTLFPNLTAKAAITAAVCVTAGAAVTATATTVVYNHKTEQYKETIDRLEAESAQNGGSTQTGSSTSDDTTAVRVVDGRVEVWDGSEWVDYGSVDEVASKDPYYENGSKREETEKSVAAKKLADLGYAVDENGNVVKLNSEDDNTAATNGNTIPVLVGNKVINNANAATGKKSGQTTNGTATANNTAAVQTPAGSIQVVGLAPTISSIPDTSAPNAGVTNVSWTAQPTSSGSYDPYGGSSGGGGSSGSSGGGDGGGAVSSTPTSTQSESSSTPEPSGSNESSSSGSSSESSGEGDGFSEEVE